MFPSVKHLTALFIITALCGGVLLSSDKPGTKIHSALDFPQNVFGYHPFEFPTDTIINVYHKGVIAQLFIAPETGPIDTIYWVVGSNVNGNIDFDSVFFVNVYASHVTDASGPGFRMWPVDLGVLRPGTLYRRRGDSPAPGLRSAGMV